MYNLMTCIMILDKELNGQEFVVFLSLCNVKIMKKCVENNTTHVAKNIAEKFKYFCEIFAQKYVGHFLLIKGRQ